LLADYQQYAATHGVQAMPEGYDALKQIMRNTYKKLFSAYWFYLIAPPLLLLAVLVWFIRRRRGEQ
jgi:ferric iron reductase protein FhuF